MFLIVDSFLFSPHMYKEKMFEKFVGAVNHITLGGGGEGAFFFWEND